VSACPPNLCISITGTDGWKVFPWYLFYWFHYDNNSTCHCHSLRHICFLYWVQKMTGSRHDGLKIRYGGFKRWTVVYKAFFLLIIPDQYLLSPNCQKPSLSEYFCQLVSLSPAYQISLRAFAYSSATPNTPFRNNNNHGSRGKKDGIVWHSMYSKEPTLPKVST
jgi:hypothetical protein